MDKTKLISDKLVNEAALEKMLKMWRFKDKKIVFTNGCFDLLHLGHADYLAKAASLGDVLIVGLNSDNSVSALKGPGRPICDQHSRSFLMASFFFVDAVVIFDESTPARLIEMVKPDVLVKGGDYKISEIVGYETVHAYGGQITTIPLVEGYSTSAIEQKIRQSGI